MNPKLLLAIGAAGLVLVGAFAFWLGRASTSSTAELPSPPAVAKPRDAAIDVEPSLRPGSRVEALSAEGWQAATIQQIEGDQALIKYEREALGEERVDVRLLRKPESELVAAKSATAPPDTPIPVPPPQEETAPASPPPPPLGDKARAPAGSVAVGTYQCDLDTKGISIQGAPAEEDINMAFTVTLEIASDRVYRAFGDDDDNYSYDPATGRITWESGLLASEDQPGQYRPDSKTIVTSMGGQALTCTLGR